MLLILVQEQLNLKLDKKKSKLISIFSQSKNKTDYKKNAIYRIFNELIVDQVGSPIVNKQFIKDKTVILFYYLFININVLILIIITEHFNRRRILTTFLITFKKIYGNMHSSIIKSLNQD